MSLLGSNSLPNITGWVHQGRNSNNSTTWMCDGTLFYAGDNSGGQASDSRFDGAKIYFNPSRVNGIYGASTTVQPPALKVWMCIKY